MVCPRLFVPIVSDYSQSALKPYRVIFSVVGGQVVIYLIIDGRRDMQLALPRGFFWYLTGSVGHRNKHNRGLTSIVRYDPPIVR